MTEILIGSRAAKVWLPDWREPKDYDYFADHDIPGAETFWHPSFTQWWDPSWAMKVAEPDELYTIKLSHSGWDIGGSWEKHQYDAMRLKSYGARLIRELYDILYPVWEAKHGKKRVNLNQDKEMFFGDAVRRKYDHDSVHYSCALGDAPMYEQFLDGEVKMSMKKVWAAPLQTQLDLFAEEIAATALERWVIPSNYKCSPAMAWARAVKKTVVSLTKGKSSLFVASNYDYYRRAPYNYISRHKSRMNHLIPLEETA